MKIPSLLNVVLIVVLTGLLTGPPNSTTFAQDASDDQTTRVFIFAGQSNMVGSDSKVSDIKRFPPFIGLEQPQSNVKFSYCIGRENKTRSNGWVALKPVDEIVGPELSFARKVSQNVRAPIAIIKCAAGGTHLGGDWNPDQPVGFKMYPLMIDLVKSSLAKLDQEGIAYRVEGLMWHQGENDMFDEHFQSNYGPNLENFLDNFRHDLDTPELPVFIGELCTKTIWGMDLRPRMHAISLGQKSVTQTDPLAHYVPTSQVGVEIGDGVGLHYHYGTLGQLEHGENYADAYLKSLGISTVATRALESWPYQNGSKLKLFVFAGHRNMEGERAFTAELQRSTEHASLLDENQAIAFKYSLGGNYRVSSGWEPLGPTGIYDTFGPELSFAKSLEKESLDNFAIAKFTHSGSQIVDWTPNGSVAESRNLYPKFITFIKESMQDLQSHGHEVQLAGIFYHVGENDMSFGPHRKKSSTWIDAFVKQARIDLDQPDLEWFVSQQEPTNHERVNSIDVVAQIAALADNDDHLFHIKTFDLPGREIQLVIGTPGIVELGERIARAYFQNSLPTDSDANKE